MKISFDISYNILHYLIFIFNYIRNAQNYINPTARDEQGLARGTPAARHSLSAPQPLFLPFLYKPVTLYTKQLQYGLASKLA
jgi:hypothetical protein